MFGGYFRWLLLVSYLFYSRDSNILWSSVDVVWYSVRKCIFTGDP